MFDKAKATTVVGLYDVPPLVDDMGKVIRHDIVNRTIVSGPDSDIAAFRARVLVRHPTARNEVFDLNRVIPLVDISQSRELWGTVGNVYRFTLHCEDPFVISFYTNGGVPKPIFEALAREYPKLRFFCQRLWDKARIIAVFGDPTGKIPLGSLKLAGRTAWDAYFGKPPDYL